MPSVFANVPSHRTRTPPGPLFAWGVILGGVLLLLSVRGAHGQTDTTTVAPRDTVRDAPADTVQTRRPDTTAASEEPLQPRPALPPLYGRAPSDSLPGRRPHVTVEMMLAEQPGTFLYDLGEYGWPHGWSPRGLAPHRVQLFFDGFSLDDPLTGRPRFELLPPSFLAPPRTGLDPAGGPVGVHTSWRTYAPKRPLTELRYRFDRDGLHAIEVGHSQKRRLDLFGRPGVLQITLGYGGRKADGIYNGSALRRERRLWGRLRYRTNDWTIALSDRSSRYRIGAQGGVTPQAGAPFESIYGLPLAANNVRRPNDRRKTVRNDLVARVQGPLLPGLSSPAELSAQWTSHTFDFRSTGGATDTTWTARLDGVQARLRQSFTAGGHHLTGSVRGALWRMAETNVSSLSGRRGAAHVFLQDSLRLGRTDVMLNAGAHITSQQTYPTATLRARRAVGPVRLSASLASTGQQSTWIEDEGFAGHVRPLNDARSGLSDRVLEGTIGAQTDVGAFDVGVSGFIHQVRNAVDLYTVPPGSDAPSTYTDTVAARRPSSPVRRAGATVSVGWRRDARRGLYATGHGTLLETLNAGASPLHNRLARTLPRAFGRARIGARFVLFNDLITDLYVLGRGWSAMNSRWFHPPTGRLVVPPRQSPVPAAPTVDVGPSGTVDVRAEARFRGATLFFTFQNIQAGTQLQPGTFVVPVYPLPPQQFRFGVFWPILD